MDQFRHLVISRFNVEVDFADARRRLDEGWLKQRLEPFLKYAVPSMRAQTVPAHWVVMADRASPQWFKDELAKVADVCQVLWVHGLMTDERSRQTLVEAGLIDRPWLITTRLDTDDALAETYIELVQQQFHGQEREFIEFPIGVQVRLGSPYRLSWRSNPFLSAIERVQVDGSFTTVNSMAHDRVVGREPVRTIRTRPQWCQIIHSANNESMIGGGSIPLVRMPAGFPWITEQPQEPYLARCVIAARAAIKRVSRLIGKRARRRSRRLTQR